MATVRVNGVELYYEDVGSGDAVVFVHGVWMSSRCFAPQLEGLADRHRVLALDLRGHGRSEHATTGHTVAQYARDLRAFLEALELARPVVVGWSMGALVLWDYVRQFGADGLRGVVVVDQTPSDYKWPDWPHGVFDFEELCHVMAACQTDRSAVRGRVHSRALQGGAARRGACRPHPGGDPAAARHDRERDHLRPDRAGLPGRATAGGRAGARLHGSRREARARSRPRSRWPSRCRTPGSSSSRSPATVRSWRSRSSSTRMTRGLDRIAPLSRRLSYPPLPARRRVWRRCA